MLQLSTWHQILSPDVAKVSRALKLITNTTLPRARLIQIGILHRVSDRLIIITSYCDIFETILAQ